MKKFLQLHLGSNVIELPTEMNVTVGKVVQEWDAAFEIDVVSLRSINIPCLLTTY